MFQLGSCDAYRDRILFHYIREFSDDRIRAFDVALEHSSKSVLCIPVY